MNNLDRKYIQIFRVNFLGIILFFLSKNRDKIKCGELYRAYIFFYKENKYFPTPDIFYSTVKDLKLLNKHNNFHKHKKTLKYNYTFLRKKLKEHNISEVKLKMLIINFKLTNEWD